MNSESEYFTCIKLEAAWVDGRILLLGGFMRIVLSESTTKAVENVASTVIERIEANPAITIGLATGRTMEPVYASWVKVAKMLNLSHEKIFFFMLDEYLGLPEGHQGSFKSYMYKHLIYPLGLKDSQFVFPPVHTRPLEEASKHYEQSIVEASGIDLQLLGIGQNGHIGFNEPGSSRQSLTRVVELTYETREANSGNFHGENVPVRALSMGIGTIMNSKSLLMLATGKSKADAIKYLVNHHDDPTCPATFLKSHPHFTLVLDPDAASKINLKI